MAAPTRPGLVGWRRRPVDAPDPADQLHHSASSPGRLASELQTQAFLLLAPGYGRRPNRCLCSPGHVAVLSGLGAGIAACLSATGNLGRQKASICRNKIHSLYRRQLSLHSAGSPGHGLFRRGYAQFRIQRFDGEGFWQQIPDALLCGSSDCLWRQITHCAPTYLAARCPWRSHGPSPYATGGHPLEDGWLCPIAFQRAIAASSPRSICAVVSDSGGCQYHLCRPYIVCPTQFKTQDCL